MGFLPVNPSESTPVLPLRYTEHLDIPTGEVIERIPECYQLFSPEKIRLKHMVSMYTGNIMEDYISRKASTRFR